MNHAIKISGETLTLTTGPRMEGVLFTWALTVSHPEGGSAVYEIAYHQAAFYAMGGSGAPVEVLIAVRSVFARASAWIAKRPSHEPTNIDQALSAVLAA